MPAILNISCYKFAPLSDLKSLREQLVAQCKAWGLKGTILVAPEGINLFLAGEDAAVRGLVDLLRSLPGLQGLQPKYSHSSRIPLARLKVKLKPEIIRFGHPPAGRGAGRHVGGRCAAHRGRPTAHLRRHRRENDPQRVG